MPDETQSSPPAGDRAEGDNANPGMDPVKPTRGTGGGGPGEKEAGVVGILALSLYLVLFTSFVVYCLVKIWPVPTPSRENPPTATASPTPTPTPTVTPTPGPTAAPTQTPTPRPASAAGQASPTPSPSPTASPSPSELQPSRVTILWLQFDLWDEQRLLLLVLLGGALGTLVHSLRSVYWYIGNRNLVWSWMAMYFMLPFAGAALALVFYLVVRGGFFSPQSSFQQTSPFGFAAFAALIGMFSSQAVLKLKEVAEVLLSKPLGGANTVTQRMANPATVTPPPPPPPATPATDQATSPKKDNPPVK